MGSRLGVGSLLFVSGLSTATKTVSRDPRHFFVYDHYSIGDRVWKWFPGLLRGDQFA